MLSPDTSPAASRAASPESYGALSYSHARTRSRVYALRLLYQAEMTAKRPEIVLEEGAYRFSIDRLEECLYDCDRRSCCDFYLLFSLFDTEPDDYALTLVRGVEAQGRELDRVIREASEHWAVFRMPVVDRCILRLAAWEICYNAALPAQVAINEAVQLAKEYGGEDSPKFINGLLGKVARVCADPVQ
ncbi:MAG: transcription antitermination factor NusB [Actinomycetia bacterium]|nr:transcription antitermination factor NusB [Actinomycetes bacterium]